MNWQMGALMLPVAAHIAAMMLSAAFGGQSVACGDISAIWCGTPFQHIVEYFAEARDLNFFTLITSGIATAWHTLSGVALLDYDVFKAQSYSIWAFIGDGFRIMSGFALLGMTVVGATAIYRR